MNLKDLGYILLNVYLFFVIYLFITKKLKIDQDCQTTFHQPKIYRTVKPVENEFLFYAFILGLLILDIKWIFEKLRQFNVLL